jgi:hypothetical protein
MNIVIDADIGNLSSDPEVRMTQREFLAWYLRKHGKEYTNKMFHNWNAYRLSILGFRKPCNYASFRRVIWKLADEGVIVALPKPAPKDRREELFGRTYYRLNQRA